MNVNETLHPQNFSTRPINRGAISAESLNSMMEPGQIYPGNSHIRYTHNGLNSRSIPAGTNFRTPQVGDLISEMQSGNNFTRNSSRNIHSDVLSTRLMEVSNGVNMQAQTSFENNRVGNMPSLLGGRQWSPAVFQNTPKVRFVDRIDANTFMQQ